MSNEVWDFFGPNEKYRAGARLSTVIGSRRRGAGLRRLRPGRASRGGPKRRALISGTGKPGPQGWKQPGCGLGPRRLRRLRPSPAQPQLRRRPKLCAWEICKPRSGVKSSAPPKASAKLSVLLRAPGQKAAKPSRARGATNRPATRSHPSSTGTRQSPRCDCPPARAKQAP